MKRIFFLPGLIALCLQILPAHAEEGASNPSAAQLRWLEDVTYIIADRERDAFLSLSTDGARDQFIELFWKVRDPSPGSALNEFKEEHFRRLAYANDILGRGTARPGWKTDRGRIYILLGKPRSISRYPPTLSTVAAEQWFYSGLDLPGVPPFLNLLFYRKDNVGEYALFVPGSDPLSDLLVANAKLNTADASFELLSQVDPEFEFAAHSMRPGDVGSVAAQESSGFEHMILARIARAPTRAVDTSYAERVASGSADVELEYTFNYTPVTLLARAFYHPGAGLAVDYAAEILPQNLTLVQYGEQVYTTLNLLGSVRDSKQRQISAIDDSAEVHLKPEELETIRHRPLNLHGRVNSKPGLTELSLLLKSEASKQYARADQKVTAEDPDEVALWVSEPLLCYRVETKAEAREQEEKAFQFGPVRVYPKVSSSFAQAEPLFLYLQLYGRTISSSELTGYKLQVELAKEGRPLSSLTFPLRDASPDPSGRLHLTPNLDLSQTPPGDYEVVATLLEADGKRRLVRKTHLTVTASTFVGVPWLLSRWLPAPRSAASAVSRAKGSLAVDQPAEAIAKLEALPLDSDPHVADLLLEAYLRTNSTQKLLDKFEPLIASVLYDRTRLSVQKSLWCEAVIDAHIKLGHWDKALPYLERLAQDYTHRPDLLLKLSLCQKRLGQEEAAKASLQRACELDNQMPECTAP